jgi:hypothetical protein
VSKLEAALKSAPLASSSLIASGCAWSAAHINGVVPRSFSFAFTSAF